MAKQYRDYGNLVGRDQYTVPVIRLLIDYERKGDVYRLTHDGEGKSLSFIDKAFISFTFGGKKIEDFGLIATSIDNRYNGESPPAHEDFVTDGRMLNGQYYWGSHYNAREMTISLATDGITQMQLDKFKYWFQAGEIRELILAEHPNRGILARIAEAPRMSLVPFKRKKFTIVNNSEIEATIIEYKGNIELNLVMDDPFWYAIHNVLGTTVHDSNGRTIIADKWVNADGLVIDLLNDDVLKIAIEDHIPTSNMIDDTTYFSDNLLLHAYNSYKYTLTNLPIEVEEGTPVVNSAFTIGDMIIEDGSYPLSGAVIGPLYLIPFLLDEAITSIKEDWILQDVQLNELGNISLVIELIPGRNKYLIIKEYLPVKNGNIYYNTVKNGGNLKILFYRKLNGTFIKINTTNINSTNSSYSFNLPAYIRLELSILTAVILLDMPINFNDFISLSLNTFSTIVSGTEFTKLDTLNYFYSGTAISYPTMRFSIPLSFDLNGYINSFSNIYSKHLNNNTYDSFILLSEFAHELKLTNPSIFNSYNKVIQKLHTDENENIVELILWFRNLIGHYAVRNWIINCINIYYNNNLNLDNQLNKIIIGTLGKQQLLNYMPYLFVSAEEALITSKEILDVPQIIKSEEQALGTLNFRSNYNRLQITQNTQGIYLVRGFLNRPLLITVTASNNNALFYLWEYSYDGNAWFEMLLPMYDSDTSILKCNSLPLDWNGRFLKCVVSNNVDTIGDESTDPILKLVIINDNLSITRVGAETVTLNQNSTTTSTTAVAWNIAGNYFSGQEDGINYAPRLYYLEPGENKEWVRWINDFNTETSNDADDDDFNFRRQLDPRIIGVINKGSPTLIKQNLNKIYLSFTPSENALKNLRGTKFKIRLYKISAEVTLESLLEDNNNYVESLEIIILIKRIEFSENAHISLNTKRNGENINNYEDFPSSLECFINTLFYISLTGIINRTKNTKCYILIGTKSISTSDIYWSLQNIVTLNYNSAENNFTGVWTYTSNINNNYGSEVYLRFYLQDYSLKIFVFKEEDSFQIILKDLESATASINQWITEYKQNAIYLMDSIKLQLYEGDAETLYVKLINSNNFPAAIQNKYIITYLWQFSPTRNGSFSALANGAVTYANTNSEWGYLLKNNTLRAGFYKAVVTLQFYDIANNNYITVPDVSPTDIIEVQVIPVISFGELSCNMQNWKYYSQEPQSEKWSDSTNNKIGLTQSSNLIFLVSCQVQNCNDYKSYRVIRTKNNASDTFTMGESCVSLELDSNNRYIMSFHLPLNLSNLQTIYNNNAQATFQFIIEDYYGSSKVSNTLTINIDNSKIKRLKFISFNLSQTYNDSWETGIVLFGKSRASSTTNEVIGVFSASANTTTSYSITYPCRGQWTTTNNTSTYTFSGIPKTTTTITNNLGTTVDQKNISAASIDWGIENTSTHIVLSLRSIKSVLCIGGNMIGSDTRKSWKSFYTGYNAEYKDLLEISYTEFSDLNKIVINFSNLIIPTSSRYKYKFRVIQNNTVLVSPVDISTRIEILGFGKTAQAGSIKVQLLAYQDSIRTLPTELKDLIYLGDSVLRGVQLTDVQAKINLLILTYSLTINFTLTTNSVVGYY